MLKVLDHLEEWLISFLMGAATLIIFVAVMHRYAGGVPIPGVQDWLLGARPSWAQELCIYHVRMDGEVRRRLRRSHRHPRRRRRPDQPPERAHSRKFVSSSACSPARVHRHRRHAGRDLRLGEARTRDSACLAPDLSRTPKLDRLPVVPLGSYLMCFRFLQVTWASLAPASCRTTTSPQVEGIERGRVPGLHRAAAEEDHEHAAARRCDTDTTRRSWPALICRRRSRIRPMLKLAGMRSTTPGSSSRCWSRSCSPGCRSRSPSASPFSRSCSC